MFFSVVLLLGFSNLVTGQIKVGLGHILVSEGKIDVTSASWTIAGEISFSFFRNIASTTKEQIENLFKKQEKLLEKSRDRSISTDETRKILANRYIPQNNQLIDEANKLEYEIEGIISLVSSPKRNRRGLIDAGGKLLKFLFGTAEEKEITNLSKALEKLKTAGEKQQTLIAEQVTVSRKLFVEDNRQNELLGNLTAQLSFVTNEWAYMSEKQKLIYDSVQMTSLDLAYIHLKQILLEARQKIHSLEIDLNSLASHRIPINLLKPKALMECLTEISKNLRPEFQLPTKRSNHVWPYYHALASSTTVLHENGFQIFVKIPLISSSGGYELYKIMPFPTIHASLPSNLTTVYPSTPYIAIKRDERSHYLELDELDLKNCINLDSKVCSVLKPIRKETSESCNLALYHEIPELIQKNCHVTFRARPQNKNPLLVNVKPGTWVFTASETKVVISCAENDVVNKILENSGILEIPTGCTVFGETFNLPAVFEGLSNIQLENQNFSLDARSNVLDLPVMLKYTPRKIETQLQVRADFTKDLEVSLDDLERSLKRNEPIINNAYDAVDEILRQNESYQYLSLSSLPVSLLTTILAIVCYHFFFNVRHLRSIKVMYTPPEQVTFKPSGAPDRHVQFDEPEATYDEIDESEVEPRVMIDLHRPMPLAPPLPPPNENRPIYGTIKRSVHHN